MLDIDSAAASPLGNAVGTNIRFVPSFGLNSGDIITLTFTGALYTGSNVKLVAEEAAARQVTVGAAIDVDADGFTNDVVEVASNFGTVDATNGVSSVQMRVNNGLILPTGIHLVLQVTGANTEDADNGALDDATDHPTFLIPAGTGGNICVASSGVTSGAIAIPAATNTNDGCFADIAAQFSMTAVAATSTIDVGADPDPRQEFLAENASATLANVAGGDTNLVQSEAVYTFNNDAGSIIEDFILLDDGDIFTVNLISSTSLTGVNTTTVGANFIEADQTASGANVSNANNADIDCTVVTGSTTTLACPLLGDTNMPDRGTFITDSAMLAITSTDIITDRSWTMGGNLVMDADVAQIAGTAITIPAVSSHVWTTNGTVLESTYTNTNESFNNRFVLSNIGSTDAPYSVTCLVEDGNTCTPGADGTVPAGGVLVLNTTDVVSVSEGVNRATVVFTIEGPNTEIQGSTQTVKPGTGIEASQNMVRPGTN